MSAVGDYPLEPCSVTSGNDVKEVTRYFTGITIRQALARDILLKLLSHWPVVDSLEISPANSRALANNAVTLADDLLEELEKQEEATDGQ